MDPVRKRLQPGGERVPLRVAMWRAFRSAAVAGALVVASRVIVNSAVSFVTGKNGLVAMELGPDLRGLKHTNTFGRLISSRGSYFDMYRFPRLGKISGLEEAGITEQMEATGPHNRGDSRRHGRVPRG